MNPPTSFMNKRGQKPKIEEIDYKDLYGIRDRARMNDRICKRILNLIYERLFIILIKPNKSVIIMGHVL